MKQSTAMIDQVVSGAQPSEVVERALTQFSVTVPLRIEIKVDATRHADDRRFRHDQEITDSEIRATAIKATQDVIQAHIDGTIKDDEVFTIYDPGNQHLNLVALLDMNETGSPEVMRIVTVMRNRDFKAPPGQRVFRV